MGQSGGVHFRATNLGNLDSRPVPIPDPVIDKIDLVGIMQTGALMIEGGLGDIMTHLDGVMTPVKNLGKVHVPPRVSHTLGTSIAESKVQRIQLVQGADVQECISHECVADAQRGRENNSF